MDTYPMACLRMLMADVVIVRECTHGQVRVLYGDIVGVEGDVMVIPANSRPVSYTHLTLPTTPYV